MERYKPKKWRGPAKAIREHCIECMGGYQNGASKLVNECPAKACALHDFRFGKNPFHSKSKGGQ